MATEARLHLPNLATHSLAAVQVPESVVKEWRRGAAKAAAAAEHARVEELTGVEHLEAAAHQSWTNTSRRGSPRAQAAHRIAQHLRRIKKMVPLDGHGLLLLKYLLSQVRFKMSLPLGSFSVITHTGILLVLVNARECDVGSTTLCGSLPRLTSEWTLPAEPPMIELAHVSFLYPLGVTYLNTVVGFRGS